LIVPSLPEEPLLEEDDDDDDDDDDDGRSASLHEVTEVSPLAQLGTVSAGVHDETSFAYEGQDVPLPHVQSRFCAQQTSPAFGLQDVTAVYVLSPPALSHSHVP
jgi:hypothetical protein